MTNLSQNIVEIHVYRRRWFVLALLIWLLCVSVTTYLNFGFVNNVMVVYFQTTYAAVDWMVLGSNVGCILVTPMIAWLALMKMISCRRAMITTGALQICNLLLIVTGFHQPKLFGLVVFGQVVGGIAMAIVWTVPSSLAQLWFPESQIGLATGISMFGSSASTIFIYVLPSQIILSPQNHNSSKQILKASKGVTNLIWFRHDQLAYEIMFSVFLATIACVLLALLTLVPEMPKKPPSQAQLLKRNQTLKENNSTTDYWQDVKTLVSDYTFIAYAVSSGIMYHYIVVIGLTSELMIQRMPVSNMALFQTTNKLAAYILSTDCAGCVVGNFLSGILLDKFKKYRLQSRVGTLLSFLISIGILLSVHYGNILALFLICFMLGISIRISYVSMIDSLMQHTYPNDPVFVMSILTFIQNLVSILFNEGGRQITYHAGLMAGLSVVPVMFLFAFVSSVIFKPTTKRLMAEKSNVSDDPTSMTPLLSQ